jgi:PAS domain S-box-containing protein
MSDRKLNKPVDLPNVNLKAIGNIHQMMIDEVEDYAIILLDMDGIIQNWNKGAEKIKQYKEQEAVGMNFRMFYLLEDRRNLLPEKMLREAINQGRAAHEGWRLRKDGSKFWGSIVLTALHDEGGELSVSPRLRGI